MRISSRCIKNVEYVMSLIKQRLQPDGKVDDNIPVPSLEAVAEVMVIMTERPNLTFEQFCEKDRSHKRVIEYLFIRAKNHYDEVDGAEKHNRREKEMKHIHPEYSHLNKSWEAEDFKSVADEIRKAKLDENGKQLTMPVYDKKTGAPIVDPISGFPKLVPV